VNIAEWEWSAFIIQNSMENLNSKDELLMQLQAFKQNPTWLLCLQNLERWKEQTLAEMLNESNFDNVKELRAEFKAYGRLLNLPDKIIQDLTQGSTEPNLDPYKHDSRSNPPTR